MVAVAFHHAIAKVRILQSRTVQANLLGGVSVAVSVEAISGIGFRQPFTQRDTDIQRALMVVLCSRHAAEGVIQAQRHAIPAGVVAEGQVSLISTFVPVILLVAARIKRSPALW